MNSQPLDIEEDNPKMDIYVRLMTKNTMFNPEIYSWCKIRISSDDGEQEFMDFALPSVVGWGDCSLASIGSTIYSVGGMVLPQGWTTWSNTSRVPTSDVHSIDTSSPGSVWSKGVSMTQPRRDPKPIPLPDGRLLVLGDLYRVKPFGEIFDPNTQTWTPSNINSPKENHIYKFEGYAIFNGGKHILLHCFDQPNLYLYDLREDTLQLYSNMFGVGHELGSSAFIDNFMYVVKLQPKKGRLDLFAFTFENQHFSLYDDDMGVKSLGEMMPVLLLPPKDDADFSKEDCLPSGDLVSSYEAKVTLLAVGNGKLAAVWAHEFASRSIRIFVSVFKMTKLASFDGSFKILAAQPLSHKAYCVKGTLFMDCIAVYTSEKVQVHGDLDKANNLGEVTPGNQNKYSTKKKRRKKKNKKMK